MQPIVPAVAAPASIMGMTDLALNLWVTAYGSDVAGRCGAAEGTAR